MSGPPRVSVLVPTYNRVGLLTECLESLLRQTLPAHQLLVVNDGSTDETAAVLARFGDAIRRLDSPHGGKPAALNAALPLVTGEYTWIFDDDDVALPEALARFVAPLKAAPAAGFSYSLFNYATDGPDGRIGPPRFASNIPDLQRRGFLIPLLEGNFLGGAALFARTAAYREVGGFDLALLRSQDYEMAIRLARRFPGVRVPGPATFLYRVHPGDRGPAVDRFGAARQRAKWLEYDQRIFRALYRELPLEAYLPPGGDAGREPHQALLQRMVVSASKLLPGQVRLDAQQFCALPDRGPLSLEARRLAAELVRATPYYGAGSLFDRVGWFSRIGRIAAGTPSGPRLISALRAGLLARLRADRRWLRPREISAVAQRLRRLGLRASAGARVRYDRKPA